MSTLRAHLPPGPAPRELLPKIARIQSDAPGFLKDLSDQYGDLASFHVGKLPVYVLSHPEGVKHVLQDQHRRYSKDTIQYRSLSTITGRGLLTSDGAYWLRQRRLAQPAFSRPRVADLDQIIIPATQVLLDRWQAAARRGSVIDVDEEMMRLTLEIVGKALFSIDLSQKAARLTQAVMTALDHIIYRARNLIVPPDFIPTPRNLRFRSALRVLDQTVDELIAARRRSGDFGQDLLGMFLQARDEETGQSMTDVQVRDEVLTMLIAGHETVASALTWTWYLLAGHPQERLRLREEVSGVLGSRPPGSADCPSLSYTAQIFSEALRLYPPAWVISRKAIEKDELLGYPVAEGTLLIISPYVLHRRAGDWEDPETFLPDRFSSQRAEKRHRFLYIPFGGGPRICIGNHFATVEAQLILAQITQYFWLELPDRVQVQADALVTLRPRHGMPMIVHPY